MLSRQKKEWLENLIKGLWGSLLKLQIIRSLCKLLPACRRLLFPLLHAEKGRPFSACNKGNRRRLRAGNVNCSLTTLFKFFFTNVICYTLWRTKHLSLITLSAGKILRGNSHTTEKWVLIGLSKKKRKRLERPVLQHPVRRHLLFRQTTTLRVKDTGLKSLSKIKTY